MSNLCLGLDLVKKKFKDVIYPMIIRSKAPLRLGLAGGGTDVSPYCDLYGGCVLNVTISMYAYCTIKPSNDGKIVFDATDLKERVETHTQDTLDLDGSLLLHKSTYNKIVRKFAISKPLSFEMTTYSDSPAGSGLGSSSAMVVAMIKAYMEWLNLPIEEYEMAQLAYEIEREDVGLPGGKQDQYAATFGGFNFVEFFSNSIVVNPLRLKTWIKNEIENSLILYYTGASRVSPKIIEEQIKNTHENNIDSVTAMHETKQSVFVMKEAILKGDFVGFAKSLRSGWDAKKRMSNAITNSSIDTIHDLALKNGGYAAKISGAGGGGFMMILCDPKKRYGLIEILEKTDGKVVSCCITEKGAQGWTIYQ